MGMAATIDTSALAARIVVDNMFVIVILLFVSMVRMRVSLLEGMFQIFTVLQV